MKKLLRWLLLGILLFGVIGCGGGASTPDITEEIETTEINKSPISLAVHDNNNTVTATDDSLRLYFSQEIQSVVVLSVYVI